MLADYYRRCDDEYNGMYVLVSLENLCSAAAAYVDDSFLEGKLLHTNLILSNFPTQRYLPKAFISTANTDNLNFITHT